MSSALLQILVRVDSKFSKCYLTFTRIGVSMSAIPTSCRSPA
jgi:hypothetical protein